MRPYGLYPARLLGPWDFPGKNIGVGCHFLLQRIFPSQGSELCLLHWQAGSLPLSHQGSPSFLTALCYFFSIICWEVYQFYWLFSKNQLLVSFYLVFKFLCYWFLNTILITFFFFLPLFFSFGDSIQLAGSQFPWPGTEPGPFLWKFRVLTTRSPVNSLLGV